MTKPKAVIFDIGNVLIEWQPERFFDSVIGAHRRRDFFAAIDLHAMNDRVDLGETFHDVIAETARDHPDWHAELMVWRDRWLDMAAPAIPHSVRLMRALQANGTPVFSLTNFGIQTYALAATQYDFLNQFDRDYISGHLGVIKPDTAIYKVVEDSCGAPPNALLFADDRRDNIEAAAARGWQVHHFDGPAGWAKRLVNEGLLSETQAH